MSSHLKYFNSFEEYSNLIERECPSTRPRECPGFRFVAKFLPQEVPIAGVHYDVEKKEPITLLCKHGDECTPAAEHLYALIMAFAKGDIDASMWVSIFPQRHVTRAGYPEFCSRENTPANVRLTCPGYKLCLGPCTNTLTENIPNTLRQGYEMNPTTHTHFSMPCDHEPCDLGAAYKFALYSVYYNGILDGLEPHDDNPDTDMKYIINQYGWNTALNNSTSRNYKDVLQTPGQWPFQRSSSRYPTRYVWNPFTLVANSQRDLVTWARSSEGEAAQIRVQSEVQTSGSDEDDNGGDVTTDFPMQTPTTSLENAPRRQPPKRRIQPTQFDDSTDDETEEEEAVPVDLSREGRVANGYYSTRVWVTNVNKPMMHLKRKIAPKRNPDGSFVEADEEARDRDYYSNFRLDQDAAGMINYISLAVAELNNSSITHEVTKALRDSLRVVETPSLVSTYRKRFGQERKRQRTLTGRRLNL